LLSGSEALLLHGETRPLTCLPARATSASSSGRFEFLEKLGRRAAVEKANRSLWPNPETYRKSLPAMPALVLIERKTSLSQLQGDERLPPRHLG
jgi:hypothetical protein